MNNTLCLMDRLWYHQIILWSDPFSPLISSNVPCFETLTQPFPKFPSCPSPSTQLPFPSLLHQQTPSSSPTPSTSSYESSVHSQEDCSNIDEDKEGGEKSRLLNLSSSFSTQRNTKKSQRISGRKLRKSMSCKSLGELELEEVKGFMDLGFVFKKENLNSQMVNLLPGLQRLKTHRNKQKPEEEEEENEEEEEEEEREELEIEEEEEEEEEEKGSISKSRPYLSEAWTVKRPNSLLLNLRVAKFSSTTDMKKHLKFWAKTVASEIQ